MTRKAFLGAVFSAAFAVSVAAQTGSQPGAQKDQQSSKDQQQVTVTGCLANADVAGGAAGTTGTGTPATAGQATGSARAEGQFVLNNARITDRGTAGTSGTAGAGAAGSAAAGATSNEKFLLVGGNQQELKKYLNSQVEIRGTLQPRSSSDRGAAAGTGAAGTGTGSATGQASRQSQSEMANVQRLRVTSVKQTSPTCTAGN